MKLEIRYASHPEDAKHYDTTQLRREHLIDQVFEADEALLTYSHYDRIIAGGVMPIHTAVHLTGGKALASEFFLQRRELGAINVGGPGRVVVDGETYEMNQRDGLYIGMGCREISFESKEPDNPAKFYMNSATAHKTYPNRKISIADANPRQLGTIEQCNKRTIYQYLHPAGMQTCQLCMGLTALDPGNNWNSMPCHTHARRMEVYFYFGLTDGVVFHMMGEPNETRHIVMHNEQAVISPSWSIHTGVGTRNYAFIWGMVGENQDFDDMDHINPLDLR